MRNITESITIELLIIQYVQKIIYKLSKVGKSLNKMNDMVIISLLNGFKETSGTLLKITVVRLFIP